MKLFLYYTLKGVRKTLYIYYGHKLIALWTIIYTLWTIKMLSLSFFSQKVQLEGIIFSIFLCQKLLSLVWQQDSMLLSPFAQLA
jgi:hypothetical protein